MVRQKAILNSITDDDELILRHLPYVNKGGAGNTPDANASTKPGLSGHARRNLITHYYQDWFGIWRKRIIERKVCAPNDVPEPSMLSLVLIGIITLASTIYSTRA